MGQSLVDTNILSNFFLCLSEIYSLSLHSFSERLMKNTDPFKIATIALSNKRHHFEIESDQGFFSRYEQEIINKGQFKVDIELDKSETMIQIQLSIKGHLILVCDRSLEEFEEPLDFSEKIIYKYGESLEDLGDNLYQIDRKDPTIDLFQDVFDFIALRVPMKKLHPRFREDEEDENEGGILLYSTIENQEEEEDENESGGENTPWDELKKLLNNKKDLK